ncbi:hypothetical protein TUBRATIS_007090 [Tubulinosema ratisbonensis]|uniref:Uncharacterized protein n=1 Tax=Tubulinosema ratisbonensis TaxID=291195 RepID=A0A437ANJ9_9MICR|nr:hypothetical protein TUBRATIS_007090 [Tubulinosema ratisbonensis]
MQLLFLLTQLVRQAEEREVKRNNSFGSRFKRTCSHIFSKNPSIGGIKSCSTLSINNLGKDIAERPSSLYNIGDEFRLDFFIKKELDKSKQATGLKIIQKATFSSDFLDYEESLPFIENKEVDQVENLNMKQKAIIEQLESKIEYLKKVIESKDVEYLALANKYSNLLDKIYRLETPTKKDLTKKNKSFKTPSTSYLDLSKIDIKNTGNKFYKKKEGEILRETFK